VSAQRAGAAVPVDLTATVGSVTLRNPVMTASGTSGHGDELAAYVQLDQLGAVVVKSVSAAPWAGNPAPRLHPVGAGMINSVGLQNAGVDQWLATELPRLTARGATVVASIWGFTVEDYATVAARLAGERHIVAVEVNVSCPNVEDRRRMFAHSPRATAEAVDAAGAGGLPRWAKLSPNVTDITEIAGAALDAGAEALTLTNTVMGMAIDVEAGRAVLGAGGGGVSGPPVHPVAVRAVFDCRAAFPDASLIGVGGVATGTDAVEFIMAGADAVQVGSATFADPRAPIRVLHELHAWCADHDITQIRQLRGRAHGH
jgi:dihydroorotate dehydrogenase (NAD+) catalytic subunit